jgi:hypothetical protein
MPPWCRSTEVGQSGKRQIRDTGCSFSVACGPLRSPQDATDIGAGHWLLLHVPQCDAAGQSSRVRPLGAYELTLLTCCVELHRPLNPSNHSRNDNCLGDPFRRSSAAGAVVLGVRRGSSTLRSGA